MAEEKTYHVYSFEGQLWENTVKVESLTDFLNRIQYRWYSTKDLWEGNFSPEPYFEKVYYGDSFEPDILYLWEKIQKDKIVIFPISSVIYLDEVKSYMDLGFTPWFMKAREFQQFKKDYCKLVA